MLKLLIYERMLKLKGTFTVRDKSKILKRASTPFPKSERAWFIYLEANCHLVLLQLFDWKLEATVSPRQELTPNIKGHNVSPRHLLLHQTRHVSQHDAALLATAGARAARPRLLAGGGSRGFFIRRLVARQARALVLAARSLRQAGDTLSTV